MTWAVLIIVFLILQRLAFVRGRKVGRREGFDFALELSEAIEEFNAEQASRVNEQRKAAPWQ